MRIFIKKADVPIQVNEKLYLDVLPKELRILLWNFKHFMFAPQLWRLRINSIDQLNNVVTNIHELKSRQLTLEDLRIKYIYKVFLDFDTIRGIVIFNDILYSNNENYYILLRGGNEKKNPTEANISTSNDNWYMTGPINCYIFSDPYLLKQYFTNDLLY